jgi:hypothetical protein
MESFPVSALSDSCPSIQEKERLKATRIETAGERKFMGNPLPVGSSMLFREQGRIIQTIDEVLNASASKVIPSQTARKLSWRKFRGDVACRVVKSHLQRHVPDSLKVVGPNVFIQGFPSEFDLMVVSSGSRPFPFTSSYPSDDVHTIVEVKKKGTGFGKNDLTRLRHRLDAVVRTIPRMKRRITYLTISETSKPKRRGSINYLERTRKVLEPDYDVFCLKDSRTNEVLVESGIGQWEGFVKSVVSK